jgi:DNA-binding beta-propeller fold protein YncE
MRGQARATGRLLRGVVLGACVLLLQACATPANPLAPSTAAEVPGYRVLRDVGLPGDTSRWDYQADDVAAHRLYVAHLGAGEVVVFDTQRQVVAATIHGVAGVHGLGLAPGGHRLFASATDRSELMTIDTRTLGRVTSVPAGSYPDGVAYVPAEHRVFVSDEGGSGDTVIDADGTRPAGTVNLGGDIGNSQYDPGTDRVYVAVGSTNELAAVDPRSLHVLRRYPLPGCSGAHGVQIDVAEQHRVFVSCEGNARLVTVDLSSGRTDPPLDVGDGPDVLSLDPGRNRLYVAAESGTLTVFDVSGRAARSVAGGRAGPNAHSVAVDPDTHIVYLPLTDVGGHPVLRELVQR